MVKPFPTDFLITNPEQQPDIVDTIPDGVKIVDLDDVPYRAEPQVRCAFCKHHQWHNDGYFAILSDGTRALCGNCCTANFDAVKKKTIDRNRSRLKRERANREKVAALAHSLTPLNAIIDAADTIIGDTSAALLILQEVFSDEAVADLQSYGIKGTVFLNGCSATLGAARATIASVGRMTEIPKAQEEILQSRKTNAFDDALEAAQYAMACAEFFDPTNIAKIEKWAVERGMQFGVKQFKMKGRTLKPKGPGAWQNFDVPTVHVPPDVAEFAKSPV